VIVPPTSVLFTLSLHDALPICAATAIAFRAALLPAGTGRRRSVALRALVAGRPLGDQPARHSGAGRPRFRTARTGSDVARGGPRSEEHTSELQSRENLVCRLLL